MKRDYGIPCIEIVPGAPLQEVSKEYRNQGPPEGFIDNTVYRYRLKPDGTKEFIGTMPPFPEGWDDPRKFKRKAKRTKLRQEDEEMSNLGPKREDKEQILESVRRLTAEGKTIAQAAKELDVPASTIYTWLSKEKTQKQKQTPDPEPAAQVGSQEPAQVEAGSVENSIPQKAAAINQEWEEAVQDMEQRGQVREEQGFMPEDDEPIPYTLLPRVWTEADKQLARKLKEDGLTMREIAAETGFTLRQVRGFFERERVKQKKSAKAVDLDRFKAKWIRDVMLDDLEPGVQLRLVDAIRGLEI